MRLSVRVMACTLGVRSGMPWIGWYMAWALDGDWGGPVDWIADMWDRIGAIWRNRRSMWAVGVSEWVDHTVLSNDERERGGGGEGEGERKKVIECCAAFQTMCDPHFMRNRARYCFVNRTQRQPEPTQTTCSAHSTYNYVRHASEYHLHQIISPLKWIQGLGGVFFCLGGGRWPWQK